MLQGQNRIWVILLLIAIILVFITIGAVTLYRDINSIMGYGFLGLGLGGIVAGLGVWSESQEKNK